MATIKTEIRVINPISPDTLVAINAFPINDGKGIIISETIITLKTLSQKGKCSFTFKKRLVKDRIIKP